MHSLLARFESRYGRHAPAGATAFLVAAQIVVFVLATVRPTALELLTLDRAAVLHGQVWRLFTYLAIPPSREPITALIELYWLYLMGTALESQWGAFRYQVFLALGAVGTTALALSLGIPASNRYLLLSLGLAFATMFPDYEIRLFFVLPIRMKWLGALDAVLIGFAIATLDGWQRVLPMVALANYLLFFAPTLLGGVRTRARVASQGGRLEAYQRASEEMAFKSSGRRCTVCGVTDADPNADFRVCTCDKCGGRPTEFCVAHARNH